MKNTDYSNILKQSPDALRYWKRELFGAKTPYDSWWFEGQATELGNRYVISIKEKLYNERAER